MNQIVYFVELSAITFVGVLLACKVFAYEIKLLRKAGAAVCFALLSLFCRRRNVRMSNGRLLQSVCSEQSLWIDFCICGFSDDGFVLPKYLICPASEEEEADITVAGRRLFRGGMEVEDCRPSAT